jgi:PhnB protein
MQVQPYLFFDGRTEEAIGFYQKTLGAKVEMLMRFKENPDKGYNPPGSDEKVMHACFRVGDTQVMASDGGCTGKTANLFQGFSLSVDAKTKEEGERVFKALGDGGQVQMPWAPTFFAEAFGVVADRFGVSWMVIVPKGA